MNRADILLTDQVAIVTGGGGGIGRAIALSYASACAHVAIADIVPELRGDRVAHSRVGPQSLARPHRCHGYQSDMRNDRPCGCHIRLRRHPLQQQGDAWARLIPLGREPIDAECGKVAVFPASPMSAYVTGTVIPVDGGTWASGG